jgi:hypothetical protein
MVKREEEPPVTIVPSTVCRGLTMKPARLGLAVLSVIFIVGAAARRLSHLK